MGIESSGIQGVRRPKVVPQNLAVDASPPVGSGGQIGDDGMTVKVGFARRVAPVGERSHRPTIAHHVLIRSADHRRMRFEISDGVPHGGVVSSCQDPGTAVTSQSGQEGDGFGGGDDELVARTAAGPAQSFEPDVGGGIDALQQRPECRELHRTPAPQRCGAAALPAAGRPREVGLPAHTDGEEA